MHAFMKPRVTLNAVGVLSCQLDALKYVTSFENNKAPTLQSRKIKHTHAYRKAETHTCACTSAMRGLTQSCVDAQDVQKQTEAGCHTKIVTFSLMRHGGNSRCAVFASLRHSHLTDDTRQRTAKY